MIQINTGTVVGLRSDGAQGRGARRRDRHAAQLLRRHRSTGPSRRAAPTTSSADRDGCVADAPSPRPRPACACARIDDNDRRNELSLDRSCTRPLAPRLVAPRSSPFSLAAAASARSRAAAPRRAAELRDKARAALAAGDVAGACLLFEQSYAACAPKAPRRAAPRRRRALRARRLPREAGQERRIAAAEFEQVAAGRRRARPRTPKARAAALRGRRAEAPPADPAPRPARRRRAGRPAAVAAPRRRAAADAEGRRPPDARRRLHGHAPHVDVRRRRRPPRDGPGAARSRPTRASAIASSTASSSTT